MICGIWENLFYTYYANGQVTPTSSSEINLPFNLPKSVKNLVLSVTFPCEHRVTGQNVGPNDVWSIVSNVTGHSRNI